MLTKNYLTTNLKSPLINGTAVVAKTGNRWENICVSKNYRYLLECVCRLLKNSFLPVPKGIFFISKNNQNNNYAKFTPTKFEQKKDSSGKLLKIKLLERYNPNLLAKLYRRFYVLSRVFLKLSILSQKVLFFQTRQTLYI